MATENESEVNNDDLVSPEHTAIIARCPSRLLRLLKCRRAEKLDQAHTD